MNVRLIVFVALLGSGCAASHANPSAPGQMRADDPAYDPSAHPCTSNRDCVEGTYCGTIGMGTQHQCGGTDYPPCSTGPEPRYCLRRGSGDCCPPAAPPPPR